MCKKKKVPIRKGIKAFLLLLAYSESLNYLKCKQLRYKKTSPTMSSIFFRSPGVTSDERKQRLLESILLNGSLQPQLQKSLSALSPINECLVWMCGKQNQDLTVSFACGRCVGSADSKFSEPLVLIILNEVDVQLFLCLTLPVPFCVVFTISLSPVRMSPLFPLSPVVVSLVFRIFSVFMSHLGSVSSASVSSLYHLS